MSGKSPAKLRRYSQIAFLALFLFLLFRTGFPGSLRSAPEDLRLPYPVSIFLQADPLAALANALAARSLYRGLLWSLVVLIPTFFLGRFFCGWICPLGTLNHFVSSLRSSRKRGRRLIDSNRYHSWQRLKYYLLLALLVAAIFGSGLVGVFDPISLTVRSLSLSVLPALHYALDRTAQALYDTGYAPFKFLSDALRFLLKDSLLPFRQPFFRQSAFIGLLFLLVLALNLFVTRFWCRALCPLGALLGLASRWSWLGLEKRSNQCSDCNRCLIGCQGGDDPIPGATWHKEECHLCFNCLAECPESSLAFRFFAPLQSTAAAPSLERRAVLGSLSAGAVSVPFLRANTGLHAGRNERLIRPPGAVEESAFLARCIRCGECMKVCPNNALHPALLEAGCEGFWTPVLVPRIGYCEPNCTLCGQVCPTGAIWEFSAKQKGWSTPAPSPIRIGTAFYDHGRCLPWSMATECLVCEEWCPTSPKAIYLRPATVVGRDGQSKVVRQPYVDPQLCVGCGACEKACPVADRPAIYVTSVGESRSTTNQILLKRRPVTFHFPEGREAPGWNRVGPTRTFDAASLWQYIDGDADRFITAGVVQTYTQRFEFEGKFEAVVDVHQMSTPEGARKIYESDQGSTLTFHEGPYFVRMILYQEDPSARRALANLAAAIRRRLAPTS